MGRLGETKLAKRTLEEIRRLITEPVQKKENEISFGEFMNAYDPFMESHNFTYLVPDNRNFLNLQIYNTMMCHPFVVLKLAHPLLYHDGLTLEFHFEPTNSEANKRLGKSIQCSSYFFNCARSIQCSNEYLYNGLMQLDRELYEGWERKCYPRVVADKFRLCLEEKELFRREYFPKPILDAIEEERSYQKSLEGKNASNS